MKKQMRALVAGSLMSMIPFTAHASEDWLRIMSGVVLGSQALLNATHLGNMSGSIASRSSDHFNQLNDEKRRDLDRDIDAAYHNEQDILSAARGADHKIADNKERLKRDDVRQNEEMQKQIKRNINLWQRMKERAAVIEKAQRAEQARRDLRDEGLAIGN